MSGDTRYAERASELLARAIPEPAPPRDEDRALAIRVIEQAMRQKAKRRLVVRATTVAAVAASIAFYFGATKFRAPAPVAVQPASVSPTAELVSGHAVTVRGDEKVPMGASAVIASGDHIVTERASKARIKLPTGTTLDVEESGDLAIVEQTSNQVFSLAVGAMRAEVAKLSVGQRFVVRTPDAEFEARGTSFRVARVQGARPCADVLTTKLFVYEGVVAARAGEREVEIGAGQEWAAPCEGRSTAAEKGQTTPAPTGPAAEPSAARSTAPPAGLQPMNDLFAEAMDAKARGDKARAVSALQRLETLYPTSPLAESAAVERMKILASTNPKAAAALAKRYLASYPDGFARTLAEGIAAKGR